MRLSIELSGDPADERVQASVWQIRARVWDELIQHGLLADGLVKTRASRVHWSTPIFLTMDVQGDPRAIEDAVRRAVQDSPRVRALAVHVQQNTGGAG